MKVPAFKAVFPQMALQASMSGASWMKQMKCYRIVNLGKLSPIINLKYTPLLPFTLAGSSSII
jgi:hypothetical protein